MSVFRSSHVRRARFMFEYSDSVGGGGRVSCGSQIVPLTPRIDMLFSACWPIGLRGGK